MAEGGVTLIKRFTYRGVGEEFSNTYHFTGTLPTTPAAWKTLVDSIAAAEKTIYPAVVKIVRAYCYTNTDNPSVATVDYTALGAEIAGTFANSIGKPHAPGDVATWVRWSTAAVTSKGKPIYLRKYYHGVVLEPTSAVGSDSQATDQKTPLTTFGTTIKTIGGLTLCGPGGASAQTVVVAPFVTTRTLKRRGKRPPLAP